MAKTFNIDFNKTFKPVLIAYAIVIVIGIIMSIVFGVKLDINFRGGTVISYNYTYSDTVADINTDDIKSIAEENLKDSVTVTKSSAIATDAYTLTISLAGNKSVDTESFENLTAKLNEKYPDNGIELYSSTSVSPTLASQFLLKSLATVVLTSILVVIYVGFRFRKIGGITAALTALASLVLDIVVAFLVCPIFGLQIDSNFIAVVLTILGYSLNDTIVVYDRVRENKKILPELTTAQLVNESLNRVKIRNIVTTVTTTLAILTIIVVAEIYGLTSLRTFAIPMAFGLISGCISSLFVSAPLWVIWRNKLDAKKK